MEVRNGGSLLRSRFRHQARQVRRGLMAFSRTTSGFAFFYKFTMVLGNVSKIRYGPD
jgi:hypothetical protein